MDEIIAEIGGYVDYDVALVAFLLAALASIASQLIRSKDVTYTWASVEDKGARMIMPGCMCIAANMTRAVILGVLVSLVAMAITKDMQNLSLNQRLTISTVGAFLAEPILLWVSKLKIGDLLDRFLKRVNGSKESSNPKQLTTAEDAKARAYQASIEAAERQQREMV